MKIRISREALLPALLQASRVANQRNTVPILANVLIEAGVDDLVQITATNADVEMKCASKATVAEAGATTVPAKTFFDVIRSLPKDADASIAIDENCITVKSGKSRFKIGTLPPTDFPIMEMKASTSDFQIAASDLVRLLGAVREAQGKEETRHYLCGVYLHNIELDGLRVLRAVATDGHRLILCDMPAPDGSDGCSVLIPSKTVSEIINTLSGSNSVVSVYVSAEKIRVQGEYITITSRLVDGKFPDYTRVIPRNHKSQYVTDANAMRQSVERVHTIATGQSKYGCIAVDLSEDHGSVACSYAGDGATDALSGLYTGDPIRIGFNGKYLSALLSGIDGDAVIKLGEPNGPVLAYSESDPSVQYVLMPMRI